MRRLILTLVAVAALLPAGLPAAGGASAAPARGSGTGVPSDFSVEDLSFVSATDGWAIGLAGCDRPACTRLIHTTDGGRHWTRVHTPGGGPSRVRFATSTIGYAFDRGLEVTRDGAKSWHRVKGGADSLAITAGHVVRLEVAGRRDGCPVACRYRVLRAPVGGHTWRVVAAPRTIGPSAGLIASGQVVIATYYQNTAGGEQSAHVTLFVSRDAGATFHKRGDPCGTHHGREYDGDHPAVAPGGRVAVLCTGRTGNHKPLLVRSTDGAKHFGAARAVTAKGVTRGGALAITKTAVFVSGFTPSSGRNYVDVSRDGGRHFSVSLRATPSGDSDLDPGFLGFQTGSTGRFVGNPHDVYTTTDAGRHWTRHHFHRSTH